MLLVHQSHFFYLSDTSDDESEADNEGWPLVDRLKELATTHDLVQQKHQELTRTLSEVEVGSGLGTSQSVTKLKETSAMFKITADAMAKVQWCSYMYMYALFGLLYVCIVWVTLLVPHWLLKPPLQGLYIIHVCVTE